MQRAQRFSTQGERDHKLLINNLRLTYKDTRDWQLWERNGLNVAMFSTGTGDELYVSYKFRDAGGNVYCLITDLQLM